MGSQPDKNVGEDSRRGNDIDRNPEAKILVDPGWALGLSLLGQGLETIC